MYIYSNAIISIWSCVYCINYIKLIFILLSFNFIFNILSLALRFYIQTRKKIYNSCLNLPELSDYVYHISNRAGAAYHPCFSQSLSRNTFSSPLSFSEKTLCLLLPSPPPLLFCLIPPLFLSALYPSSLLLSPPLHPPLISSSLLLSKQLVHVGYWKESNNLLVIALPAERYRQSKVIQCMLPYSIRCLSQSRMSAKCCVPSRIFDQ